MLEKKKCHPYQIGGVEDHLHICTSLHPTVTLAGLIKDVKLSTSDVIKRQRMFPGFDYWQDGYGGFTHSFVEKDRLIKYVARQEEHHKPETFREEFIRLLRESV